MQLYQKSESVAALRKFWFVCVDDTDGKTAETGLTFSGAELQVIKPGGAFANMTNSGTVVERTDGLYEGELTASELDTSGSVGFKVEKTGVRTTIMVLGMVVGFDPSVAIATQSSVDVVDNFLDTEIADIQARLPASLVSGRMDSSVGAMAANTVTAAAIATDAIDTDALSSGAANEIAAAVWNALTATYATVGTFGKKLGDLTSGGAVPTAAEVADAVWDEVIVGTKTARQLVRGFAAALISKVSGWNTGLHKYRDTEDTKDVITATVGTTGRTAVTLDLT